MDHASYRWIPITRQNHPDRLHLSPVVAEAIAITAAGGEPAVLVREQHRYLLLGPQDRRLPRIAEAARAAEADGWPAFLRIGGGSAVLLDEGTLSFGAARPCRDLTTLVRNFRELAAGAVAALHRVGLPQDPLAITNRMQALCQRDGARRFPSSPTTSGRANGHRPRR